ncbi:MAG TPA: CoB--CoM heterodisulfide reductase iron-sulfur subunit B family protein [Verrucomicrobiota bacterium]|jgi:heterodisulfide reductase subunit B|nr:CoB--CoM heterodisulfide reductase iron-sulfur subunit B family protein [Verrucomicrobiota bacterium]HRT07294.1 CoB--CoM heterodisulfide reductase iron-sulfur subunit B family protein [Candidatus Paceibacterota bacterium]HRT55949.1 CoB--CoM heterodisulfide reductase iron-sulfur subunit B family protein [Candidatus Paceibacterota bacterium]
MKYLYFPGCSLKGLGRAYEESLLPVMRHLGVELVELDDWNCCGATAYMSVDEHEATVLAARNLAIAERSGPQDLLAPCSACYLVLNKAKHNINDFPEIATNVKRALDSARLSYKGSTVVRHPLDVLFHDVGVEAIKQKVVRPLTGLKVAPYYGCQVVRPYATFDEAWNPVTMDKILAALGAEVLHYPLKTKCCGGSLTGTVPEAGLRMSYILLKEAVRRGADVIATICPLCQFNLDAYHDQIVRRWGEARIATVYFTQLMGLAFGFEPRQLGLHRNFVPIPTGLANGAGQTPARPQTAEKVSR